MVFVGDILFFKLRLRSNTEKERTSHQRGRENAHKERGDVEKSETVPTRALTPSLPKLCFPFDTRMLFIYYKRFSATEHSIPIAMRENNKNSEVIVVVK